MKILAWIFVIWIVVSLVYGTVKEGTSWTEPFKAEYKYHLKNRPLITVVVTVLICIILITVLF